jgi:hypothetical protein
VEGFPLEFRLMYRGPLPAASSGDSRVGWKHRIRTQLHKQLKAYWDIHPELIERTERGHDRAFINQEMQHYQIGDNFFLPLLSNVRGLACALEILFLRRDSPGKVVSSGGDIDNRLKVLFDALRVPQNSGEIPSSWVAGEDEKPLYCLLDDDQLITALTVTTDRLLTPLEDAEGVNDVVLIIQVRAIITNFTRAPWGFIAN